jgi:hypothetical protein
MLRAYGSQAKREPSPILVCSMSDALGFTPIFQHGGRRPGAGRPRKGEVRLPKKHGSLKSTGSHSRAYILGRLARDAAAGCRDAAILLAGVTSQTISAHTAGCEMNYCRRPEPTGRGSPNMTKARDWALYRLFNPRPDKGKAPPAGANGAQGGSSV